MTGLEPLVIGYLTAWAVRKAQRVGNRADGAVDQVLDSAMDRLDALVRSRIGGDAAIARLEETASAGEPDASVTRAAEQAVASAATADPAFAAEMRKLVDEIRSIAPTNVFVQAYGTGQARMPVLGQGTQHNTFS